MRETIGTQNRNIELALRNRMSEIWISEMGCDGKSERRHPVQSRRLTRVKIHTRYQRYDPPMVLFG